VSNNPVIGKITGFLKLNVAFISIVIKISQILMLLAGLAAFIYGAYELGLDLWFALKGIKTEGYAVGHEVEYETRHKFPDSSFGNTLSDADYTDVPVYRPTIRYLWPPVTGDFYTHSSTISFEGEEMDLYKIGNKVQIMVLPNSPSNARLPGGFTHYLWAIIGFVGGLFAVVVVSSLFYMYEGLFGGDFSKGLSLFRSVSWPVTLWLFLATAIAITQLHQLVFPWVGPEELLAIATGDIRLLPPLLASRGAPKPGHFLNEAESSIARIPYLGIAFADEALERALITVDDTEARRYLSAMADPATRFPVQSVRVLAYAAEHGKTEIVKSLLALGVHPDTTISEDFEPIRQAARHNQVGVIETLLAAGAKTDFPNQPLILSAIEGRSKDAVFMLLAIAKVDLTWRKPNTNHTLADLALINGMADISDLLGKHNVPITLPAYYKYVVTGDQNGLAGVLSPESWKSVLYRDVTMLHLAARYHQLNLARKLVALGADPNSKTFGTGSNAYTPLIEAVIAGDIDLVKFFSKLPDIKINLGDLSHITPLAYAVRQNRWDIAEALVSAGADVNVQIGDYDGNTLLHIVAKKGDYKKVHWLLVNGADIQMKNFRQLTPLEVARSSEVIDILKQDSDKR
jgi:ankyrin repeat protein